MQFPNRWYLGDIIGIDNWSALERNFAFSSYENLEVDLHQNGLEMDFSLTSAYGIPIVSDRFRNALEGLAGISFAPIKIRNKHVSQPFYVLGITHAYSCIDETNSSFSRYLENDPVRPDKAGRYSGFYKLIIDRSRKYEANIFRVQNFEIALIVDEEFKEKIEGTKGLVGCRFVEA